MLLPDFRALINKYSFVSFDIFDTLLVRPYVRPTDLFLHMEKAYERPGFSDERRDAERRTRIRHPELEDITFDMIYEEIDEEFKDMKQKEMDWEEMVLRANPELKQVYDYAKEQGKKIIIASDMYLPTEFIAKVLRKNGYDGWDGLYVSGDLGKTKCKESLYRQILKDFACSPQNVLHIGDNKQSDYKKAKKLGIAAVCYGNIACKHQKVKDNNALGLSVCQALSFQNRLSLEQQGLSSYWFNLGFDYAGPVAYAYARFIEKEMKKKHLDMLFFIARDGYLLQKIFANINPDISTKYVYAPRILNNLLRLNYVPEKMEEALTIIKYYAQKDKAIAGLYSNTLIKNWRQAHQFIQENMTLFRPLAQKELENYRAYIQNSAENAENIGIVDTITGAFSSQKLIETALKKSVCGVYWGICDKTFAGHFKHTVFAGETHGKTEDWNKIFTENWNFMEFLMSSPEHPILKLDKNSHPVYAEEQSSYEIKRSEVYSEVVKGALAFAEMVSKTFNGNDIYLSAQDVIEYVNKFIENPTGENINEMSVIRCCEDAGHQIFIPLFSVKDGLKNFIKNPVKTLKTLKKCIWHTPIQTFILCLCKPVNVRTRGIKKIYIALLPYLKKQYVALSLRLSEKTAYKLTIGNMKG